jgi:hypothetical protein
MSIREIVFDTTKKEKMAVERMNAPGHWLLTGHWLLIGHLLSP